MARPGKYHIWLESAAKIQQEADKIGLVQSRFRHDERDKGSYDLLGLFDELVTCIPLREATRSLFRDSHYTQAVEAAFKCLNNLTKEKSGLRSKDGSDLMNQVFSANNPILRLNEFNSKSETDEQLGYMQIYAGSMTGIRNPRAHEHDLRDDPKVALELLVFANHLMCKLESATQSQT